MTTLRTAAKQALEAWDGGDTEWFKRAYTVMEALRTALVEDALQKFSDVNQELMAALGCEHCNQPLYAAVKCRVCGRAAEPTTEDSSEVEPVAWMHTDAYNPRVKFLEWRENQPGYRGSWIKTPLYTTPPERNFCPRCGKRTNDIHTCTPPAPLTDEVIAELWHKNGGFHHHFARAIERWLKGNP